LRRQHMARHRGCSDRSGIEGAREARAGRLAPGVRGFLAALPARIAIARGNRTLAVLGVRRVKLV
jgi:hypothetical protein